MEYGDIDLMRLKLLRRGSVQPASILFSLASFMSSYISTIGSRTCLCPRLSCQYKVTFTILLALLVVLYRFSYLRSIYAVRPPIRLGVGAALRGRCRSQRHQCAE